MKQDNFFEWWEEFTELAYSKGLIIIADKDTARSKWHSTRLSVEEGLKLFTRN